MELRSQLRAEADSKDEGAAVQRRNSVDIYSDILEVVKRHGGYGRITRISYGVGMPVDRLKKFLERLERFGLVKCEPESESLTYLVTQRGQEFLDTYWRMKGFLEILGEV